MLYQYNLSHKKLQTEASVETVDVQQPNHLGNGDYQEHLKNQIDRLRHKIEKWRLREDESIGVYRYNIKLNQYDQIVPSKKYMYELNLMIKLDTLCLKLMEEGGMLSYSLIKQLMKQHFTEEEYACDAFRQYREDLRELEAPAIKCCTLL